MSKKVFLSPSNQYDNVYAYGNTTEGVQCGKIAEACKVALERCGIQVMLKHDESMAEKCQASNSFGADLHVCIHTNAFNGSVSGTRMFYYADGGEGHKACKAIFAQLAPVTPGNSENIRANASLYEVKVPSAPTAYCECEFHDNANTAKWIIENTTLIGETIAHGICDYFGISFKEAGSKPQPAPTPQPKPESKEEYIEMELRMLRKGMEGNDVRAAMLLMKDKGYYPYDIWSGDKLFGPKMEEGLLRMQKENGLGADGLLGKASWTYLLK